MTDPSRRTWYGAGTYDGPWGAYTEFSTGNPDPFALLMPPVSPGLVDPYEFAGCLLLKVTYFDDVKEETHCHDG